MSVQAICLLGLGEVGSILAYDLLANTGVSLRVWDRDLDLEGRPAQLNFRDLAEEKRVSRADNAAAAAVGCDLVLSAVTADEAVNAAGSVCPGLASGTWFVDLNSVSPATKQQLADTVEGARGRFVEAAVMSPILPRRSASPILVAGPHARAFVSEAHALGFEALQAVSDSLGIAAATKMCRSVIIKGMEALVTESLLAARHYGVDDAVLASLDNLFPRPDWHEQAHYLISRSVQHGERRAAEMREVAKTVDESGVSPWMSASCAERQQWAAQYKALLGEETLGGLLDAIRAELPLHEITME